MNMTPSGQSLHSFLIAYLINLLSVVGIKHVVPTQRQIKKQRTVMLLLIHLTGNSQVETALCKEEFSPFSLCSFRLKTINMHTN